MLLLGAVIVVEVRELPPVDTDGAKTAAVVSVADQRPATPTPTASPQVSTTPTPTPTPTPTLDEGSIPMGGSGEFAVAAGTGAPVGTGTMLHYTVEVETDLQSDPDLAIDPAEVAAVVDATLADPRGWTAKGEFAFERTAADPDVRLLVATPDTTDALCAPLKTRGEVSCRNGSLVVLNAKRWVLGIEDYLGDLAGYRRYLVNHEMGHAIGFGHVSCPGPGTPAPVMQQQTYGLDGCARNSWPYP